MAARRPSLWTQNANAPVSANDNVWETALEVNVPLLKDVPLAQDLNADIAGRYTDYSISGDGRDLEDRRQRQDQRDLPRSRHHVVRYSRAQPERPVPPVGISSTGFNDLLTRRQQRHPAGHQGQCRPDAGSGPYLYLGCGADAGFHSRLHHLAGLLP